MKSNLGYLMIVCLSFSFIHLEGQDTPSLASISLGSKATISLETKDSIKYSYRIINIESFTKILNTNSKQNENLLGDKKTNCLEIVFCNGTYGDNNPYTFLFIKNWYKFPIEYKADILKNNKIVFEITPVTSLYPGVLTREDWPYKIEKIKFSGFQKMLFPDGEIKAAKNSTIKYIGTDQADKAFASLFKIITSNFENLPLNNLDSIEQEMNSRDITPGHYIELGEGIYPNKKHFKLETPRTYERIEDSTFTNQIEYYYTKKDHLVKAILFEWNKTDNNKNALFSFDDNIGEKANKFSFKFNKLENDITKQIGKYAKKKIESLSHKDSFRDDIIWNSKDGLVVYMFMLGNGNQNFRQIRVAIYKE